MGKLAKDLDIIANSPAFNRRKETGGVSTYAVEVPLTASGGVLTVVIHGSSEQGARATTLAMLTELSKSHPKPYDSDGIMVSRVGSGEAAERNMARLLWPGFVD
jgi:hypothetical protein